MAVVYEDDDGKKDKSGQVRAPGGGAMDMKECPERVREGETKSPCWLASRLFRTRRQKYLPPLLISTGMEPLGPLEKPGLQVWCVCRCYGKGNRAAVGGMREQGYLQRSVPVSQ